MFKHILLLVTLIFVVVLPASAQTTEVDIEANRELEEIHAEGFSNADWDAMRSVIADDFVLYQPLSPESIAGKEAVIGFYQSFHAAMPDIGHPNVNVLLADSEWVAVLMPTVGTFENELMGIPPTNEPVITYMLNFFNVQDGLMTEAHFHFDTVDMLQQMGAIPLNPDMSEIERSADELIISFETEGNDLESNKQVLMGFFEDIVNKQDLEPVPEYFTEDWVFHNRTDPHEITYTGHKGVNQWANSFYSMIPDFTLVLDDLLFVAEGDLVAVRWTATGTHTLDVPGILASGNEIFISGAALHRIRDGKISETWFVIDTLSVFAQMGLVGEEESDSKHSKVVATFDIEQVELPEGVAVDLTDGTVYVSLTPRGELIKFAPDLETWESVSTITDDNVNLLGLAVDTNGHIFGAVKSENPEINGVWMFDGETGEKAHIAGTEAIMFPNSIAFDSNGTMYVTDTISGAIWTAKPDDKAELWLQDPLLEGDESIGFGFRLGANGIVVGDDKVFVANTEIRTIVSILILDDGSAGEVAVLAQLPEGEFPDGLTMDVNGNIYVAMPLSNSVIQVSPDGAVTTIATVDDGLDAPTSVAYYTDGEIHSVYAVNFSVALVEGGAGPSLVRIHLNNQDTKKIEIPAAIEGFNQALYGDATGYEEYIHPEWKWFGNGELQFEGYEGFVNATGFWTAVFPDLEVEVIDAIGEGDRWAVSYRITGTNTEDFEPMGVVATGNSMEMYMNSFFYLEDGMLKDCYNVWDWITWFDALGMPYGPEADETQG